MNTGLVLSGTGHRMDKLGGYAASATQTLIRYATKILASYKPTKIISGMALGWDQALAEAAMTLQIPFVAAVPFMGQESRWPGASQDHYKYLLGAAEETVIVSPGGYTVWKMQTRNEWMVDNCEAVLALWDGSSGGTANCVRYARKAGKRILNVWPGWEQENANDEHR